MRIQEAAAARPPLEPVWKSGEVSKAAPAAPAPLPYRSVRDLFSSEEAKPVFDLDASTKSFLQAGALLTKHSKTAQPKRLHVYLSADCTLLIWNKPMTAVDAKHTMACTALVSAERGHTTPQLRRVRFGRPLAGPPEHCFSVFGVATDAGGHPCGERTVDLEASSFAERERWADAIEHLCHWVRTKKLYGKHTVHMDSHQKIEQGHHTTALTLH